MTRIGTLTLLALVASTTTAAAQLIAVTPVPLPLAGGDQFSFFPSSNFGMAGVSIAIPDSVHDPFMNPAKGGRLRRSYLFGAPTFFSVSANAGNGSTLPLGVMARSGSTFGGIAGAIQSLTDGHPGSAGPPPPGILESASLPLLPPGTVGGADDSHANRYGFVMLGHTFPASKLSIGASAMWSGLAAIDGVNQLYADSRSVSQSGGSADVRVGMLREWKGGQSLEAVLLHHRTRMTDDVIYADQYWDPIQRQVIERPRVQRERERTNTLGMHLQYERPLADSVWRVGAILTANRLDHPNTPEYEIASMPSDRGRSSAFNFGAGLTRSQGGIRVAVDAIYEPIMSHLWAVADSAVTSTVPGTIQAGGTTVDNRLRFSNALLRAGFSQDVPLAESGSMLRLQFGVQARSVSYKLEQRDLVRSSTRTASDRWMEWSRSWGAIVRFSAVELHYAARLTTGGERPGVAATGGVFLPTDRSTIAPFPGPSTRTTMNAVRVTTHQLSISVPIH
jgi:hypothetical protein